MDPSLVRVLGELPESVREAIFGLGIRSPGDFHHFWPSAQKCYEELEALTGQKMEAQGAMKVAVAWTNARRCSLQATEALGLEIARERQSSVGGPPRTVTMAAAPAQVPDGPPSNKVRKLTPSGLQAPLHAPMVTHAATVDAFAREDAMKQAKLDQLFVLVVENVVGLAELQMTPAKLADPMARQAFKNTLMTGASRLSGQRLGALSAAWKRWLKYCAAHAHDARQPGPLVIADFLREVSSGGPTAASSMHASLRWFADNFGAAFSMEHWAVKHYRFHAVHHTGKQAPELEPWEFINLAILMTRVQGSHKVLVAFILMVATGCIRFEHVQRSHLVRLHGAWVEFECSQGKARKQGARPGYHWGVPQVTMNGQHMTKVLQEFFTHEFNQDHKFLLPALALEAEDLWEITEATPFITNKPMSRARFLEVMRGALVQVGVDFAQAQAATFNKLRRFMPTMANVMELPDLDLQSIGNWTELPAGGGRDPSARKPRGVLPMGVHYAGSKVHRSLQVKQRCVDRLLALYHRKRSELAMTEQGYLCRDAWQWAEVAALHQSLPEELTPLAQTATLGAIEVDPGGLDGVEKPEAEQAVELPLKATASSSSDASTDESSSASDESADAQDLCGVLADSSAPEDLSWLRQGKKVHLVREGSGRTCSAVVP